MRNDGGQDGCTEGSPDGLKDPQCNAGIGYLVFAESDIGGYHDRDEQSVQRRTPEYECSCEQ
ncbi:hypothetical protein D3C81_1862100 [compost metagenome]